MFCRFWWRICPLNAIKYINFFARPYIFTLIIYLFFIISLFIIFIYKSTIYYFNYYIIIIIYIRVIKVIESLREKERKEREADKRPVKARTVERLTATHQKTNTRHNVNHRLRRWRLLFPALVPGSCYRP